MNTNEIKYDNMIEGLISIFTIDKGKFKILLIRKKNEPYKGHWLLPNGMLSNTETLEDNIYDIIFEKCGFSDMVVEQVHIFSDVDRYHDKRVIGCSFVGLIDSKSVEIKREDRTYIDSEWFPIDQIPKMGYDHDTIVKYSIEYLQKKIIDSNVLKSLFPSDFTLPELQRVYEQILDKKLDRRNFRKKFINLDLIEYTGYKNEGFNGRPAKLYCFKEDISERNLF